MLKVKTKQEEVVEPEEEMVEDEVEEVSEEEPIEEEVPVEDEAIMEPSGESYGTLDCLKRQTANAVALWTNYKRYHWMLAGPLFFSLHDMFGDFADASYGTVDELAERVRMLDDNPPASLDEFSQMATVTPSTASSAMQMVSEALSNVETVIEEMRKGAADADAEGDPGSVDMFSKFVQIYEKQRWFLKQHLTKG